LCLPVGTLSDSPHDWEITRYLAYAYEILGKPRKAHQLYTEALQHNASGSSEEQNRDWRASLHHEIAEIRAHSHE
jgi:hypothetical protein